MRDMTRGWHRYAVAVALALTIPVTGTRAVQPIDPVRTEISRWLTAIERNTGGGALWDQVKPGAEGALRQALLAVETGRRAFALERLAAARALLAAAAYVAERPAEVRGSVASFEAEWTRMGTSLGAALTPPAPDLLRMLPSSAARALTEVASHQVKVNYDASLIYGRATDADSGLYYLGAAQAQQQFVAFARELPRGAARATLRSLEADAHALERTLLSLYQPPASIERHAEFIAASAALKEARELTDAGLHYGALLKFLQATQRTAQLQTTAVPRIGELRARLSGVERELSAVAGDHSLARVFLDRVAMELEKPSPEAPGLAASAAILESVVPAYRAALAPSAPMTPAPEALVTVRLVRWPFT
jgi:hypothetical protein